MKKTSSAMILMAFFAFQAQALTPEAKETGGLSQFLAKVGYASASDLLSLRGIFQERTGSLSSKVAGKVYATGPLGSGSTLTTIKAGVAAKAYATGPMGSGSTFTKLKAGVDTKAYATGPMGSGSTFTKLKAGVDTKAYATGPMGSGSTFTKLQAGVAVKALESVSIEDVRYLYSKRWGWLDMKHFSVAAHDSSTNSFGCIETVFKGALLEAKQLMDETQSAFSYEDMSSNKVGAYFAKYIEKPENKGKPFTENLANYLKALEVVEDPSIAPNYATLTVAEKSMGVVHAIKQRDQAIDKEIESLI